MRISAGVLCLVMLLLPCCSGTDDNVDQAMLLDGGDGGAMDSSNPLDQFLVPPDVQQEEDGRDAAWSDAAETVGPGLDVAMDVWFDLGSDQGTEPDAFACLPQDSDCDGLADDVDNCPDLANEDQADADADDLGDVCDPDDDGDGIDDGDDAFPLDPDEWADTDGDGIGDNADFETCDGLDNDGDGQVDEGLPVKAYFPDNDGDGYGASAGTSCASLLNDGVVEDGIYKIWPASIGGPSLKVWCDMTHDGGGWTRIFYHDVVDGFFLSDADAHASNVEDPESNRYSILNHLEAFRSADKRFEFRIDWPETAASGRNIWRQTSNPTVGPVAGYEPVAIDHLEQYWGGLEPSNSDMTYLDGSVNHGFWFYSVGSQVAFGDPAGIPSYNPAVPRVAVWVRPDDALAGGMPIFDCTVPDNGTSMPGDCDDSKDWVYPGAKEECNGMDDDCDGIVDEECPFGDVILSVAPKELQFYPRDLATDLCTVTLEGELDGVATDVLVVVAKDGVPVKEVVSQESPFVASLDVQAGLHLYDIEVFWDNGTGWWKPAHGFKDVVCGDVYLIDGQSNAVAVDYHNELLGDKELSPFVRSYGSAVNNNTVVNDSAFGMAVANTAYVHGAVGQWGLRLGLDIMNAQQMPILIINGAVGGTTVAQHQRNDANPTDLNTIYGRLLWRVQQAGVAEAVRGIFWHQGESDGNMAYDTYLALWTAMYDDWLEDYPHVEGIYPFQVRAGCGNPTWNRNVHRELPGLLAKVIGHMSTTGVDGHDNCHFFHAVYVEWGQRLARLVNRDLYGSDVPGNIEAPDPVKATWLDETHLEIDYGTTGGGLVLQDGTKAFFSLSDGAAIVAADVVGETVVLTTSAPSAATWVSLVDLPGDIPWLVNDLGIGGFAYYQFPIGP